MTNTEDLKKIKIKEIRDEIASWKPLPSSPEILQDKEPIYNGLPRVYLKKAGNDVRIYSTNEGDLEISYEELNNRIGMTLEFFDLTLGRLELFREFMLAEAERFAS